MKLLIATDKTQGKRDNDFNFADKGEVCIFGSTCSRATPDDNCGCARAMVTPTNAKATTTMEVAEVDGDKAKKVVAEHYKNAWKFDEKESQSMADEMIEDIAEMCQDWEIGTVVEKRGNRMNVRVLA